MPHKISYIETILFNKPYNVLCQFTDSENRATLADFSLANDFYACGRLDRDSEGLLILSNNGKLQHMISHPNFELNKTYWVQVEGCPEELALDPLRQGIRLNDGICKPCQVHPIAEPSLESRNPPIRVRKNKPTSWLEITLAEGRNRQIRRMTAAAGYPTLRLIRRSIGPWSCSDLAPGEQRRLKIDVQSLPINWQQYLNRPLPARSRHSSSRKPAVSKSFSGK